jgi:hypothetical protein
VPQEIHMENQHQPFYDKLSLSAKNESAEVG